MSSRPEAGAGDIGHGCYGVVIVSNSLSATDVVALEKVRQSVSFPLTFWSVTRTLTCDARTETRPPPPPTSFFRIDLVFFSRGKGMCHPSTRTSPFYDTVSPPVTTQLTVKFITQGQI